MEFILALVKVLATVVDRFRAQSHLVLELVGIRCRLDIAPAQATGKRRQGEGSFCFNQQTVINVLKVIKVINVTIVTIAHLRVPLSSLDRSNDFASLGRDNNCLNGVPRPF